MLQVMRWSRALVSAIATLPVVVVVAMAPAAAAAVRHAGPGGVTARPASSGPHQQASEGRARTGIFLGAGGAGTPPPVPTPPWWNGMCDSGYNAGFAAAGSWDGLIACGPGGTYRLENQAGSPLSENWEWECVELSERWLYQEFGIPQQLGNGYQTVGAYWSYIQAHPAAGYPLTLVTPSTASAGSLGPGDVVSYANVNGDDGHTDVVTATNPSPFAGTGTVTTLNENTGGFITINVSNWQFGLKDFSGNYMAATGWLHYTGSPSAPAGDLLRSGSFEGSFAGWSRYVPAGVTVNMVNYNTAAGAPAKAHDGGWYLAFNTSGAGGAVYQDVPVNAPAGTSFVGTAWLSAQSGTATGSLCLWGLGASSTNNCIPYSVGAGSYKQVQIVYDAPQNIGTLRFQVYPAPGGGTTDMDTASLK